MREEYAMKGDNGLYLFIARVVRSWSMGPQPMWITNCYCPIYCNPFVVSSSGAHLCTCSMRNDGAKESYGSSLWMRLCGCTVVLQLLFLMSLEFLQEKLHAPLVLIFHYLVKWVEALFKEVIVFSLLICKKNTKVTNIVFFRFHSLMTQLANSFSKHISAYHIAQCIG